MTTTKICSICKQEFPLDSFYPRKDRAGGYRPACKGCTSLMQKEAYLNLSQSEIFRRNKNSYLNERQKATDGDINAVMRYRYNCYKSNAKRRGVPFNLTKNDLILLFNDQNGLCYYTGQPLKLVTSVGRGTVNMLNTPDQLSLDRKVPSLGYTKGNVVWCTYLINSMKNMLTDEQFYKMCRRVLEIHPID